MSGMNANTGKRLSSVEHIHQSVADILATPTGSRVMRRDYGSLLPELIDRPVSEALMLQVYAATVMALLRWEPRLRLTSLKQIVSSSQPGQATLEIAGITMEGSPIRLEAALP